MGNSSRKYIDLIHSSSSKWANWDPPNEIKVGDYGTINKKTGQFEREWNIYEDPLTADLVAGHPPIDDPQDDKFIISSFGVKYHELKVEAGFEITGLAEASIKGQWEFGKKRGALLIMARPRSRRIPPHVVLKQLIKIPSLADKVLVTEVLSCPAYSLYLSGANPETVSIALVAGVPATTPAPGLVPAAGGVGMVWRSQHASGVFREACDGAGRYCYTPLCSLRMIKKPSIFRRREGPQPELQGDDLWMDPHGPWDMLDEEGEEEGWEDTVFD